MLTGFVVISSNGAILREQPGLTAAPLDVCPKGTMLEVLQSVETDDDWWYLVEYDGEQGYLSHGELRQPTVDELMNYAYEAQTPEPTQAPVTEPTLTPVPTATPTPTPSPTPGRNAREVVTFGLGAMPVYAGPGANYERLANGKATLGSNSWCYWYGNVENWALVEYELNNGGTRIGWVYYPAGKNWQADTGAEYFLDAQSRGSLTPVATPRPTYNVGDIIEFGSYEQDNNTTDGAEAIEWQVLATTEDSALLMSRYVLDCVPYYTERSAVTWETSNLRKWMNETFYQTAFTDEQKQEIMTAQLNNEPNPYYPAVNSGNSTTDKLFTLSYQEANRLLDSSNLNTAATEYARAQGAKFRNDNPEKKVYWWLRTPGKEPYYAVVTSVNRNCLDEVGNAVGPKLGNADNNTGVRVFMWIRHGKGSITTVSMQSVLSSLKAQPVVTATPVPTATPTPEPTATPTATPNQPIGIGTVKIQDVANANVREKSNEDSTRVGRAMAGQTYPCLSIAGNDWYKIQLENGTVGYISQWVATFTANDAAATADTSAQQTTQQAETRQIGIGTIRIQGNANANVREKSNENSTRVGRAMAGQTYPCLSIARNGWYKIQLEDGTVGYISDKVATWVN